MDSSPVPAALPVPIVSDEQIDSLPGLGERMKVGLKALLDGDSLREAAARAELASHQDLHRYARRLGIGMSGQRILDGHRRIARLALDEIERRLVDDAESVGTKDLGILAGISSDKVAKAEAWGREGSAEPGSALDAILTKLAASGGEVVLKVEPSLPVIDVTPEPH